MSKSVGDLLREMDAKATKGPWAVANGGGVEIDRITGRGRPNPKPFVAEAMQAAPDGPCIARPFERAKINDASTLVSLRNALPQLAAVVERAVVMRDWVPRAADHTERGKVVLAFDAALRDLTAALQGGER